MYLEKLEIQGFKSFANKNTLVFPGILDKERRGITAVVGPNGSGKSNTADAVRWALGEQSMKTLRGKKSEDIIFSGSDKKGRLGMAEVSLFLNNEDKKNDIDYSQIILTRRLYRNGDSEYLINNSRVRLTDVQILLAKAKFGQKTYSVIGQGMVEGFLNTSLAERKEFFDEATGVKQFQIKRDDSLNKLRAGYENLSQAQMLISEIEPRLKTLTRQVNKLQRREEIEKELKNLQLDYYGKLWNDIEEKFNKYNAQFLEIEKEKIEKEKKIANLNHELTRLESQDNKTSGFNELQEKLVSAQNAKDNFVKQLARIEAQKEIKLEASGRFDLSFLLNKKNELIKELEKLTAEINEAEKNNAIYQNKNKTLENKKRELNEKINSLNNDLIKTSDDDEKNENKKLNSELKKAINKLENAGEEADIKKIKAIILEIKKELEKMIKKCCKKDNEVDLKNLQNKLLILAEEKEKISHEINENNIKISTLFEKIKLFKNNKEKTEHEINNIEAKLKQNENKPSEANLKKEEQEIKKELNEINEKINKIKGEINSYAETEKEKREELFALQKDLQNLQNDANTINNQLNDIKINSTRYETRLENLEIEIRNSFASLQEVKKHSSESQTDLESNIEKINQLKHQLDLIGGIDPEIEKEYQETKERFDFLDGQVNDLEKAISSLKEVIKELDVVIKERFDKEFKTISSKFEEYFKILFNGGRAKIIKVIENTEKESEEKNDDEEKNSSINKIKFLQKHNATGLAGIEIQATPPGKKIGSVSMLSGGERALTAIALICAIISANPSPFVVLDEVDAALDEANSERLAKILDDLSHKTQFIVITHNRASMRRANILYGVTMGDDGVSRLLSIKLEENLPKTNK